MSGPIGFDGTGVDVLDDLLAAIASAARSYHNTNRWNDDEDDGEGSEVDKIDRAAGLVADFIRELQEHYSAPDSPAWAMASRLHGRQRGAEITDGEEREAADAGLVVIFGKADVVMRIVGAIDDEAGFEAYFSGGPPGHRVEAFFCQIPDVDAPIWTFETSIPHATFDVMDDNNYPGLVWCRGIIFDLADTEVST